MFNRKAFGKPALSMVAIASGILITLFVLLFSWFEDRRASMTQESMRELAARMEARQQDPTENEPGLLYRLYVPAGYSREKEYPLVISLHSAAGNGTDNISQIDTMVQKLVSPAIQQRYSPIVAVPQCPPAVQWTDIPFSQAPLKNYLVSETTESAREKAIVRLISELRDQLNIDNERIYITGFSMGSSATWDILFRHPDIFAAAITMSGISSPQSANKIAHIPIWACHGYFDRVSPVSNSVKMYEAVKKLNGAMRLTKFFWGHGVINIVAQDDKYLDWLFAQRRQPQPTQEQKKASMQ